MVKKWISSLAILLFTFILISCKTQSYIVTFDTDGGSLIEEQTIEKDGLVERPEDPTKDNYVFIEWQLNGEKYEFDTLVKESFTIKALWRELEEDKHEVSFNSDGGNKINSQLIDDDGVVSKPNNPTKDGYVFIGWVKDGDLYDFNSLVKESFTLTALWEEESNKHTVKFDTDGGTIIDDQKINDGEYLLEPNLPTKDGYIFVSWLKNGFVYYFEEVKVEESFTLTALWEKVEDNNHVVTFDTDGGTIISPIQVKDGETIYEPFSPKKENYIFVGWEKEGDLYNFNNKINESFTLKAIWEEDTREIYTVIFLNEKDEVIKETTVREGDNPMFPEYIAPEGYVLIEWDNYDVYDGVYEDITTKAIIEQITFTINYYDINNDLIHTEEVVWGDKATYNKIPEIENKEFLGWFYFDTKFDLDEVVPYPMDLKAKYKNVMGDNYKLLTDEDFDYVKYEDYYKYNGNERYVIVPEKIDGKIVESVKYMFSNTDVISASFEKAENIKDTSYMFRSNTSDHLILEFLDTSNVLNMRGMFSNTNALEIEFGNFNTENVEDMSYMFSNSSVEFPDLSSFDTKNVINMNSMFESFNGKEIDLSMLDVSNVLDMNSMFRRSQASKINLKNFNSINVLDMSNMFNENKAWSLTPGDMKTDSVTNMSGMFRNAEANFIIRVDEFDTANVTDMSYMFANTKTEYINVTNLNTQNVLNMDSMFYGTRLKELDLTSFDTSKVENMNNMFSFSSATIIDVSTFNTENVVNMRSMFEGTNPLEFDLTHFDTKLVEKMDSMFKNSKATKIDVSTFDTSNLEYAESMFENSKVKLLNLSSFEMPKVQRVSRMFKGLELEELDLSSFIRRGLIYYDGMFENVKIKKIYFDTIGSRNNARYNSMFKNAIIDELHFRGFDLKEGSSISNMFEGANIKKGYANEDSVDVLNSIYKSNIFES